MSIVKNIIQHIEAFFQDAPDAAWSGLKEFVAELEAGGGKVLEDAATKAVADAEATGKTGAEKAAMAFADVVAVLKNEGVPLIINAAEGAIRVAVAKLKVSQTAGA